MDGGQVLIFPQHFADRLQAICLVQDNDLRTLGPQPFEQLLVIRNVRIDEDHLAHHPLGRVTAGVEDRLTSRQQPPSLECLELEQSVRGSGMRAFRSLGR